MVSDKEIDKSNKWISVSHALNKITQLTIQQIRRAPVSLYEERKMRIAECVISYKCVTNIITPFGLT